MYANQDQNNRPRGLSEMGAGCEAPKEDYVSALARAKSSAEDVTRSLYNLIAAITGPRPDKEPGATAIEGKRSLKDALENTPGEIGELSHTSLKRIEEIRQLLRL